MIKILMLFLFVSLALSQPAASGPESTDPQDEKGHRLLQRLANCYTTASQKCGLCLVGRIIDKPNGSITVSCEQCSGEARPVGSMNVAPGATGVDYSDLCSTSKASSAGIIGGIIAFILAIINF